MLNFPDFSISTFSDDIQKIEISFDEFIVPMAIVCDLSHWDIQVWLFLWMIYFYNIC